MTNGPSSLTAQVPARVKAVAAGQPVRAVWENELGGLTFEVGADPERRFVKWAPAASGLDLGGEVARLPWAAAFTPVPALLGHGSEEAGAWMITSALPGDNAIAPRWIADPTTAVRAIGAGLRALHEALPVEDCPFSWSVSDRLATAPQTGVGQLDPARWHDIHQALTVEQALTVLAEVPPIDRLVVCHGDSCSPNTLLTDDGRWSGHVDLGALGTADRWADLAVATWSAEWNYGPGWEDPLLDAYGIAPDPQRTAYYRLLWDLTP